MTSSHSTRLHLPALGYVGINFFDSALTAFKLYQRTDEISRQSRLRHLGLIAQIYSGTHHTRWEYAALQCAIADLVERLHKDNPEIGPGCLRTPSGELKGSELLKTWCLLGNFGHCANTFADEKALLTHSRDKKSFATELLSQIPTTPLRQHTRDVIETYSYTAFHWCLASARIARTLPKHSRDKRPLLYALELALIDPAQIDVNTAKLLQLRMIHRLIRKLAIVCIDAQNSHFPMQFDLGAAILNMDLSEHRLAGQSVEFLLDSLLSSLTDTLYTDPDVIATIRSYELQALAILPSIDATSALDTAFNTGLIDPFTSHLKHSHRQTVPRDKNISIYDQQRLAERLLRNIEGIHAGVDDNPFNETRHVDFLVEQRGFRKQEIGNAIYAAARNLYNVTRLRMTKALEKEIQDVDWWETALQEKNVPQNVITDVTESYVASLDNRVNAHGLVQEGCASVIRSIIDLVFDSRLSLTMNPGIDHTRYYGLWMTHPDGGWIEQGDAAIASALAEETEDYRKNEIELVRQQRIPPDSWFYIACFGSLLVLDFSKPPGNRRVTDIDGLSVSVGRDYVFVHLFEAKPTRSSKVKNTPAIRKLKQTILPLVVSAARPGHETRSYVRGGKLTLKFRL